MNWIPERGDRFLANSTDGFDDVEGTVINFSIDKKWIQVRWAIDGGEDISGGEDWIETKNIKTWIRERPESSRCTIQRKYTIDEIDEMRNLIGENWFYNSEPYKGHKRTAEIEEILRTYMMAGTSVEEIRSKADKLSEEHWGGIGE